MGHCGTRVLRGMVGSPKSERRSHGSASLAAMAFVPMNRTRIIARSDSQMPVMPHCNCALSRVSATVTAGATGAMRCIARLWWHRRTPSQHQLRRQRCLVSN